MPGVSPSSPDDDDRAMVHALLTGAPGAFARFVAQHQRLVWLLVQRLVRDGEDTRELCQEVFLRVSRTLPQFRFESALRTWVGRIATSVALNHLARKRLPLDAWDDEALAQRPDEGPDPRERLSAQQQSQRLRTAIDALPPLPRLCVSLHYLEELPVAEVAALTALPENTVKSHLLRSRERLRRHLEAQP